MSDESERRETDELGEFPSQEAVRAVLAAIAPGSALSAIRPLPASYSNLTHLVEALAPGFGLQQQSA